MSELSPPSGAANPCSPAAAAAHKPGGSAISLVIAIAAEHHISGILSLPVYVMKRTPR